MIPPDSDTFICVWCKQASSFPGARVGEGGWACSSGCYGQYVAGYWKVRDPEQYGQPTNEERRKVGAV